MNYQGIPITLPKHYASNAYPHYMIERHVGFLGRQSVFTCTCGLFSHNKEHLLKNHEIAEMEFQNWLKTLQQKSSTKSGPFYE